MTFSNFKNILAVLRWVINIVRIIVAGCREFNDYEMMKMVLDKHIDYYLYYEECTIDDIEIIEGECRGADLLVKRYAEERGYKVTGFPANWNAEGLAAGPLRNQRMAMYAAEAGCNGTLIAFWDGKSRGTKNMIDCATKKNLLVYIQSIEKER